MKRIIFVFLCLQLFIVANSQKSLDILTLSGRYGFPASYEKTYNEKATEMGSMLALTLPIVLNEKSTWIVSFNHFYFNVKGDKAIPSDISNPINLNGFILRTGLYQKFGNGLGLQILFVPRYMTDFNGGGGSCFQLGGVLMLEKVFSERLTMSIGAQYNDEFFGPLLVPIINVDWQISPRWKFAGMLPVYSKLSYKVNNNLDMGLAHFGLVTSYYLGKSEYKGDYIQRNSIDLTLYGRQRISGNIFFELRGGMALGRSYDQYAGDQKVTLGLPLVYIGDERTIKSTKFGGGPILDLRLIYSIPIPK
jgi:hypothetical protein